MQLTSLGAAQTTTGSQHLIEVNGHRILLDCGLLEGKREASFNRNRHFPFDPKSIDAVLLSHAHIDHSGNLPNLCQQGFEGNIYCTSATRDLSALMLQDSAKVQASDAVFVNKKRARQGLAPVEPLYNGVAAEKAIRNFVTLDYHRKFPVCDGVMATFFDAGHILGSSQILLDIQEGYRKFRLLFSGDLGRGKNDILRDPEIVDNVDYLLMESTYGGQKHEDVDTAKEELNKVINRTLEKKGKLIIPSFAVGRAQHLVYILHMMREENLFPQLPIFVDSPMAVNATEVFRLHPECFNDTVYEFLQTKHNPFGWEDITYIREVYDSMKLNDRTEPCIIISASGMCEAGRILHHLRNSLPYEQNTILFVGHCAEATLGHRILAGEKIVKVFGEEVTVNAEVAQINAFSGHADDPELVAYAAATAKHHAKVFLVHGEPDRCAALEKSLQNAHIGKEIVIPENAKPIKL
jgi:metallo-beta-lactamase family protein